MNIFFILQFISQTVENSVTNDSRSVMVVFDNLARILREIVAQYSKADDLKEWKLLGQEAKGRITVGWIEESSNGTYTCVGIYQPKTNNLRILCRFNKVLNIVQASVNSSRLLLSYVVKEKLEENVGTEVYKHYLTPLEKRESNANVPEISTKSQSIVNPNKKQIMTNFLESTKEVSKLLVFIHREAITMYHLRTEGTEAIQTVKTDVVTKAFSWAQWDCDLQALYFIHFRKTSLPVESEDSLKQELSPTLSCLQFHENLPHETVLNIPLNLPSMPPSTETHCQIYEDDPLPLRIHDCSLDLVVVSDPSGIICICHHYLYQPVKPPETDDSKETNTVHFAYSVTLLHHGYVIHNVVPEVPWSSAKTMRPVFTLLGAQYLVVYAAEVFTHLLDIGFAHEPYCHILMGGSLSMVPQNASRLVPLRGEFSDSSPCRNNTELEPTVVIDILTMDLIEFEVTVEDLMNCLTKVQTVQNRLSVLHYFLVHATDIDCVEEALTILLKNPTEINVPKYFQEVLIGGAYYFAQKNLPSDANPLLKLLPMTCVDPSGHTETKVNQIPFSTTQEILWNTAKMLLSPQQRLVPFISDIWKRLWDHLASIEETPRFKPSQVADKLAVSLGCYQPEALSCCSTPMSPGTGFVTSFVDFANMHQAVNSRKNTGTELPFLEVESCTASKQEHIISVNLRELSLYLLKHCLRDPPTHVHPVATRYVSAQLEISRLLCHLLSKIAGIEDETEKGFSLIQELPPRQRLLLFTYYQRYFSAVDTLAYPLPQGFSSFFCYLGFTSLSFDYFLMYLQNSVFELQIDVMKEIMKDISDTKEGVEQKLRLLFFLPRSRAKRLLHAWPHGVSLMIRAREHALNILSGVQSSRPRGLPHSRRVAQTSRGLAAFPSADGLSPLDTFLDLLTAKASLTDLDFNLLIDATISSTQDLD